jgi:hypothetical protein
MSPLLLSASCRFLRSTPLVPIFSVLISVSRADGSFVTNLTAQSFDFGYFPTGEQFSGVGLEGLVTNAFQNYAEVPNQVAPGFYGLSLSFPSSPTPYVPMLFVTVTEIVLNSSGTRGVVETGSVAQGQIVIGKIEDAADFGP